MQQIPANIIQQIEAELKKGNKILAIKLYKEATNVGLLEAKNAIDAWQTPDNSYTVQMTEQELFYDKFGGNEQAPITTTHIIQKVYDYLAQNQKLAAIKWVRDTKRIGLKEAKDFVDYLEEHPNTTDYESFSQEAAISMPNIIEISEAEIVETILAYLKKGQKIEAVKWYRELKDIGLKEAKIYIDSIEDKHNIVSKPIKMPEKKPIVIPDTSPKMPQISVATPEIEKTEKPIKESEKVEFQFSPIVYDKKNKNTNSIQMQLVFLLLLGLFVYIAYKLLA